MTDAPEQIWAYSAPNVIGVLSPTILAYEYYRPHAELYTRTDIHDALTAENERLLKIVNSVECYWDADDRERGHSDIYEIIEWKDSGVVSEIEHVAVVRITFESALPAADDSDSDDGFEVSVTTREAAEDKIKAELNRRTALAPKDTS